MVKRFLKKRKELAQGSNGHYAMPGAMRILLGVVVLIPFALLFTWFILYRQHLGDGGETWVYIIEHPLIFWYSALIMYFILGFVVAILWRVYLGLGLVFSVLSILTYINAEKFQLRQMPLLPEDFAMTGNVNEVAGFVDPWGIVRLVCGILFILVGSGIAEYWIRRLLGRDKRSLVWWQRWAILPRLSLALLSAVGFMISTDFIIHHGGSYKIDWLDTELTVWNQADNYKDNGLLIGFIFNLGSSHLDEPRDYSEEAIARIKDYYDGVKARAEKEDKREDLNKVVENVVVILDETFYDPEILKKYYPHTGGDILPNLHRIFREYPSGYMYSPAYGGGTANVEFEVLTGLSNYWSNTTPYNEVLAKSTDFPSIVWAMRDSGLKTTALHSFDGTMYKRNLVYPNIGYEKFIDEKLMQHTDKENGKGQISDREVYREVLDMLKNSDDSQFIGVATMQNHAPYCQADYGHYDYIITDETDSQFNRNLLTCSFQSLHMDDEYLGEFLDELDDLDEKTVVLWFGDHAAGILGAYVESDEKIDGHMAHLTPYFVYSNFELPVETDIKAVTKQYKELGFNLPTKGIDLPMTTPNCLSNTMYNLLNVKKPAMMYLLDEVCEEMPILSRGYSKEADATDALKAYELLNYDLLHGKQYWK